MSNGKKLKTFFINPIYINMDQNFNEMGSQWAYILEKEIQFSE